MAKLATIRVDAPVQRNAIAASLANPCFRKRTERNQAGRGSYTRKDKHKGARGW